MNQQTYFNLLSLIALAVALVALFTGGPGAVIVQESGGEIEAQAAVYISTYHLLYGN